MRPNRYIKRGKTRPFMPVHGRKKKTSHNRGDEVMKVGADAMIDDIERQDSSGAPESAAEAQACQPAPSLEEIRAERDSYLDLARRERADFDNYRKRVERDMKQIKRDSLAGFLKEFFGPLDDMGRVLAESEKNHSFESLVQGVRIMEENFWRALTKAGVTKIEAQGQVFDPNLHEAMVVVPSADVPPNTILEVYENGYRMDDSVLRPARVVVSRAPDQ